MEKELIKKLGLNVKNRDITWQQASEIFSEKTGINLTGNALRKRFEYIKDKLQIDNTSINNFTGEYETYHNNGVIEAQKIVNLPSKIKSDPNKVLEFMGYNPDEWEMQYMTFSNWQQHTKEQTTKELYAVKFKIKPKVNAPTPQQVLEEVKNLFRKEITPLNIKPKERDNVLNDDLLLESPSVELHFGRLSWHGEVGQNYDYKIASERFYHIIEEIINEQQIRKAGTLFMTIGNDFFNSDTTTDMTTKGTPQQNDVRWKKMFLVGLELQTQALLELRKHFNRIDIQLCQGNHDKMASFYLYVALKQHFKDDNIIHFSDNLKETQCYVFGNNLIITNHGDVNLKRLIKSIPSEFYEEWGKTTHRELHVAHLHRESELTDEGGMIVRRIGSPTIPDEWTYNERFIGAIQKHQIFLWHKDYGNLEIKNIPFESKKKLIKRLKQRL